MLILSRISPLICKYIQIHCGCLHFITFKKKRMSRKVLYVSVHVYKNKGLINVVREMNFRNEF